MHKGKDVRVNAMKARGGKRGSVPLTLNLDTSCGKVVSLVP